ncbi:MAG TPA: divalent metal cation transporter [Saprospiraceae bacterium]|nr:divalent metal cation transporter [Saprospiraceae bacterium]
MTKKKNHYNAFQRFWRKLGPGLVTGASDDDPSGIATYSQAGAMFGLATLWTAVVTYPLMLAVQEMCARIGIVTRQGLTGVLKQHYPRPLLYLMILFSVPAIIINIGADIQAMGAVTNMLFPQVPSHVASIFFTVFLLIAIVILPYKPFAAVLKYLCLSLLLYLVVPFWAKPDFRAVIYHTLVPTFQFDRAYIAVLVAILGTTISPYLFFWQTSMEVEEAGKRRNTLVVDKKLITDMRQDVDFGMFLTCLVFYFIILTTGTVLFDEGIHDINTVQDAAMALRPIAGEQAYWLFAVGVIGTGMLAIPVLAGAVSYIFAETFGWKEGLNKKYYQAKGFYAVMALSLGLGLLFDFAGTSPIDALLLAAVLYGLTAPVLIGMVLHISNNAGIMGAFVNGRWSNIFGGAALVLMTVAAGFLIYFIA